MSWHALILEPFQTLAFMRAALVACLALALMNGAVGTLLVLQDAAVILLDEPFAAIDAQTVPVLLDQLMRWHREGRTVIAVMHDLGLVRARFPVTLVLARHCVAWGATDVALPAMVA